MKINWDKEFETAHLYSGPKMSGLSIEEKIYKRDEKEILAAAKRYGYKKLGDGKQISFVKSK